MPRQDRCHQQVVHALEKAGYAVAQGQFMISLDRLHRIHIDIHVVDADDNDLFIVEVKCFDDPGAETHDLYTALGQYLIYRDILARHGLIVPLYLAVPDHAYAGIIKRMAIDTFNKNDVKLIVIDLEQEEILLWHRP